MEAQRSNTNLPKITKRQGSNLAVWLPGSDPSHFVPPALYRAKLKGKILEGDRNAIYTGCSGGFLRKFYYIWEEIWRREVASHAGHLWEGLSSTGTECTKALRWTEVLACYIVAPWVHPVLSLRICMCCSPCQECPSLFSTYDEPFITLSLSSEISQAELILPCVMNNLSTPADLLLSGLPASYSSILF